MSNNNSQISQLIHQQNNHLTALYGQIYLLKSATKKADNQDDILMIISKIEKRLKAIEEVGDQIRIKIKI